MLGRGVRESVGSFSAGPKDRKACRDAHRSAGACMSWCAANRVSRGCLCSCLREQRDGCGTWSEKSMCSWLSFVSWISSRTHHSSWSDNGQAHARTNDEDWCPAWELAMESYRLRCTALAWHFSHLLELLRPLLSSGWFLRSEALNHRWNRERCPIYFHWHYNCITVSMPKVMSSIALWQYNRPTGRRQATVQLCWVFSVTQPE